MTETTQTITVTDSGTTYSATVTNASGCVSPMASKTTSAEPSDVPTLTWTTAPTPVNFGEQKVYVTGINYGLNATYSWSADGGATVTGTAPSATVKFPASGTAGATVNLTVTATNSCGTSAPLVLPITVNNACPTPVVTAKSATAFPGAVAGTGVTLEVTATSINTPAYQWYTGTAPSGTAISGANSATYIYTPAAAGTDNFYCVVTNGCDATAKGTSPAFTVTTTIDPRNYPTTASLSMSGKACFDTRETFGNMDSGSSNGISTVRTDTSSPLPQGTQDYILTVTGKTISTVTWVADVTKFYSNTATSGTNNTTYTVTFADLERIIKPAVLDGYKATAQNGQVITITAYVSFTDGTKGSISKVVKIQDFVCCDGYIVPGGAFNYTTVATTGAPGTANAAGDWAATAVLTSTWDSTQQNNGIKMVSTMMGRWSDNGSSSPYITNYFSPTGGDLCFYKRDAFYSTGNTKKVTNWKDALEACKSGAGADGDPNSGWYLPNLMELKKLYDVLPGAGGSAKPGTSTQWGTGNNSDTLNITSSGSSSTSTSYWSSTEIDRSGGYATEFSNGYRNGNNKSAFEKLSYSRCVKRM